MISNHLHRCGKTYALHKRYSIGYTEAAAGALHNEKQLDTAIGMLQNNIAQKQYTKFHYATIAPSFYTFFYTFVINREVWGGLSDAQQTGILRAARAAEKLAFVNEAATANHHAALNKALGVIRFTMQTAEERTAWMKRVLWTRYATAFCEALTMQTICVLTFAKSRRYSRSFPKSTSRQPPRTLYPVPGYLFLDRYRITHGV